MTTPNLALEKPPTGERLDISLGRFNSNADKIDAAVAARSLATHTHADLATNASNQAYRDEIDLTLASIPGVF